MVHESLQTVGQAPPKLYFCDPGLAAWLLGSRQPSHLSAHPLRGSLFDKPDMRELLKASLHNGLRPDLYFPRDNENHEVDALIETEPRRGHVIEIKSGGTLGSDFFNGLYLWRQKLPGHHFQPWLIYGGETRQHGTAVPWSALGPSLKALAPNR